MPSSSISIHALLAESDPAPRASSTCWIFLSTLSLRRATNTGQPVRGLPSYFYPRSPCGERRIVAGPVLYCSCISIHALLAESDNTNLRRHRGDNDFYPRSPCGERPLRQLQSALRGNFYPRSPCGERQVTVRTWQKTNPFLSTLSLRRATHGKVTGGYDQNDFYPRSPCGERPTTIITICIVPRFLSTLSLRRATNTNLGRHRGNDNFYPRSPCGERQNTQNSAEIA